jgi:hypothetical protein
MVALETLDTEGILLDCFEDARLARGLFVAGSGVVLLGTSSSGIISLLLGWLFDIARNNVTLNSKLLTPIE